MLFKKSPEKFWNLIASKYATSPIADRPAYEAKMARIREHLDAGMSVLDIGCGTGSQSGDIAASVDRVTGIDISSKLLAIAEQRMAERQLDNVEFVRTSVFDERFRPGTFDAVLAFFVLHFFEDIDGVFRRIHELLGPGGLFVSETACLGDRDRVIGRLLRAGGQLGLLPLINPLTTRQLEASLQRAGFELFDKTRYSQRPDAEFTLMARKVAR